MAADKLRQQLRAAREELGAASEALAPKHRGGEWERYHEASRVCLSLERELARELAEECAVEIDWPVPWDTGAPLPHVVSSSHRTLLLYRAAEPDPNWDGTSVRIVAPAASETCPLAIVEFQGCQIFKFGGPNDEVLHGHPLHEKGLEPYAAHVVERSRWIAEQEKINSVHRQHDPERWRGLRHYLLAFHDETFECIAVGHSVRTVSSSFADALGECARSVLG